MIRWLGMAAAGFALLVSPLLAGLGTGQTPAEPVAEITAPWTPVPLGTQVPSGPPGLAGGLMAGPGGASAGEMIGFSRPAADGGQLLTLIDTARRWMAVYHIEGSGRIHLKSSRPLTQDFAVQYNAAAPLPEDMRQLAGE